MNAGGIEGVGGGGLRGKEVSCKYQLCYSISSLHLMGPSQYITKSTMSNFVPRILLLFKMRLREDPDK